MAGQPAPPHAALGPAGLQKAEGCFLTHPPCTESLTHPGTYGHYAYKKRTCDLHSSAPGATLTPEHVTHPQGHTCRTPHHSAPQVQDCTRIPLPVACPHTHPPWQTQMRLWTWDMLHSCLSTHPCPHTQPLHTHTARGMASLWRDSKPLECCPSSPGQARTFTPSLHSRLEMASTTSPSVSQAVPHNCTSWCLH